jgi:hypothetical protein
MDTPWRRATEFYWAFLWRWMAILCGMMVPFIALYGVVKYFLESWPLLERIFRLICLLAFLTLAAGFAIRWAAKSRFRGYALHISQSLTGTTFSAASPPGVIALGQAFRLFGAHVWRYAVVVLPINLMFVWVIESHITRESWLFTLITQAFNLGIGFVFGIWAMRAALNLKYRGFEIHWINAKSTPDPSFSGTQTSSSVGH